MPCALLLPQLLLLLACLLQLHPILPLLLLLPQLLLLLPGFLLLSTVMGLPPPLLLLPHLQVSPAACEWYHPLVILWREGPHPRPDARHCPGLYTWPHSPSITQQLSCC
jgi:hypothetical protein